MTTQKPNFDPIQLINQITHDLCLMRAEINALYARIESIERVLIDNIPTRKEDFEASTLND